MYLRAVSTCVLLLCGLGSTHAANFALLRDATVTLASTPGGSTAAKLSPVTPSTDVYLIVLSDSLTADDVPRVRHEISSAFSGSFLSAHPVHLVTVVGPGGDVSSALTSGTQLQLTLKRLSPGTTAGVFSLDLLNTLGGVAGNLTGNWSNAVVVGRLPAPANDEIWVSAWLGAIFRKQHIRLSFWSLDGTAPAWAQSLAAASAGLVSTSTVSALLPTLNDDSVLFQADWDVSLKGGAWPYQAELKSATGQTIASFPDLAAAPNFLPPLTSYLAARADMRNAAATDEPSARKTLDLNPADADALKRLATLRKELNKLKESAAAWKDLSEVTPGDGSVWAELGLTLYAIGSFEESARALDRAVELGVKNRSTLEVRAELHVKHGDFSKALPLIQEALLEKTSASQQTAQSLWLLRAECARNMKHWPDEADSLEHAAALAPLPLDHSTRLIEGYLAGNDVAHAMPHLRRVSNDLPRQATVRAQYAEYWERVREPSAAEPLWKSAVEYDAKFEPAYVGLVKHYLEAHRSAEALKIADDGLNAVPSSITLVLAKENALESLGDIYGARRLLTARATGDLDSEILKRRAFLEDAYGSAAPEAYAARLQMLVKSEAPQADVVELCRRGLLVSIRNERYDVAKTFADVLAKAGDRNGQDLLQLRKSTESASSELLGGVDAFNFLVFGGGKANPDHILVNYSRKLSGTVADSHEAVATKEWLLLQARIHEYFQIVGELAALGERKNGHFEISLNLGDKAGKQRTEKVFGILGLKLKSNKEGLAVKAAVGKSEAKKQDTLAALAIDDASIQEALAAGKSYTLEIPIDSVPIFPNSEFWQAVSGEHDKRPGGMAEWLVANPRTARLFYALNSMDRETGKILVRSISIRKLDEHYSSLLSLYGAALTVRGGVAEVPGGPRAATTWQGFTGVSPATAVPFIEALLNKDEGRTIAFFYSLSQLDAQHQQFFTRSPERLKRFYDCFRESAEMRRGGERRLTSGSFVEFLREVPLNDDLSVNFPGSAEVWMVAKGGNATLSSVAKLNRKMKRSVAPDSEDAILLRLATSGYKTRLGEQSELANFIATVHIDAQRSEPLSPQAALLLAQGYANYAGLYSYLGELGDLDEADYQKLFSLADRFKAFGVVTANLRLGGLHSFLAMTALLRERGNVPEADVIAIFRKGLDRYLAANGPAAWAIASLNNVDDLDRLTAPHADSHNAAVQALMLGNSASARRQKLFAHVLTLQKAPSLDALFTIRADLDKIQSAAQRQSTSADAVDDAQRQVSTFVVLPIPKAWRVDSDRKKYLDLFTNTDALAVIGKIREKQAKRKQYPSEVQKLADNLTADLEPWVELALVSRIYARYLDPSDLLVSEDPMLVRKHEFAELGARSGPISYFTTSNLQISSAGEGSYFIGGLAEFALSAGEARSSGNHIGGTGEFFAKAIFSSIRATDWSAVGPAALQSFGATVRIAREWIVQSAVSQPALELLEQETLGLLSLNRRRLLIDGIEQRDWPAVWESVSVSDLYFLGQMLLEKPATAGALSEIWKLQPVSAMRQLALQQKDMDALGAVAPSLNGCPQPRLRRYAPYEEYERYYMPGPMAQRTAELKLYLAWIADNRAWADDALEDISPAIADKLLKTIQMRDPYDWSAIIAACRSLTAENLEALMSPQ